MTLSANQAQAASAYALAVQNAIVALNNVPRPSAPADVAEKAEAQYQADYLALSKERAWADDYADKASDYARLISDRRDQAYRIPIIDCTKPATANVLPGGTPGGGDRGTTGTGATGTGGTSTTGTGATGAGGTGTGTTGTAPPPAPATGGQTGMATPYYNWTGFYVGVNLGGSWGNTTAKEYDAFTHDQTARLNYSSSGVFGGVNFGYNFSPWNNNIVVGAAFDVMGGSDRARKSWGDFYIGSNLNFMATGQARVGVAIDQALIYVQGGLAIGNQQAQLYFGGDRTNTGRFSTGWTVGAGIEYALPPSLTLGGRPVSLYGDYRHIGWGTIHVDRPAAEPESNYSMSRNLNMIVVGARIRF